MPMVLCEHDNNVIIQYCENVFEPIVKYCVRFIVYKFTFTRHEKNRNLAYEFKVKVNGV